MPAGYTEPSTAIYAAMFIAAFVLASAVATLALVLYFFREGPLERACACLALALVTLALALSCAAVAYDRSHIEELLRASPLSACSSERVRYLAHLDARASAALALSGAPFALLVATFVAARSLRKRAWLSWATPAWALLAATGYLYLQPLPGRLLWPGRCALYSYRDAVLGADHEELRRGCYELSRLLKDPRAMAQSLGTESLAAVLPELPALKKRCLAEMLEELRHQSSWSVSRGQTLRSPFVTPEDVPEVTRVLDEIAPIKAWDLPWDGGELPFDGGEAR